MKQDAFKAAAMAALEHVERWLKLPLAAPEDAYHPDYIAARKTTAEALRIGMEGDGSTSTVGGGDVALSQASE